MDAKSAAIFVIAGAFHAGSCTSTKEGIIEREAHERRHAESELFRQAAEAVDKSVAPDLPALDEQQSPKMDAGSADHEELVWDYDEDADPMTGKITAMASLASMETYELDFPYQGGTFAHLIVRHHPRKGNDVMFSINTGQLQCFSYGGCRLMVRFDESAPITVKGVAPSDGSHDVIFLASSKKFIASLKKAKQMKVELPFFQQGTRLFTFGTAGFTWAY